MQPERERFLCAGRPGPVCTPVSVGRQSVSCVRCLVFVDTVPRPHREHQFQDGESFNVTVGPVSPPVTEFDIFFNGGLCEYFIGMYVSHHAHSRHTHKDTHTHTHGGKMLTQLWVQAPA